LELDLDSGVPVRFKRDFEDIRVILKVPSHPHEVDVVVEAEVRIDHDNSERVHRDLGLHSQKGLEDVGQLGNDPLTIKEVTATSYLDRAVGKYLDRLGTVGVMIRQCHLIVKGCRLQLPFKTTAPLGTGSFQFGRLQILKN